MVTVEAIICKKSAGLNMIYTPLSSLTVVIRQKFTFMPLHSSYLSIIKAMIVSSVLFIHTRSQKIIREGA